MASELRHLNKRFYEIDRKRFSNFPWGVLVTTNRWIMKAQKASEDGVCSFHQTSIHEEEMIHFHSEIWQDLGVLYNFLVSTQSQLLIRELKYGGPAGAPGAVLMYFKLCPAAVPVIGDQLFPSPCQLLQPFVVHQPPGGCQTRVMSRLLERRAALNSCSHC